ncbi:MAG: M20 family peptidase [Anaerolineae bacterium]|jgi:carboxypeptidase PM20D1|nr:M20 family peptidase [Anaerolineae bacterium]
MTTISYILIFLLILILAIVIIALVRALSFGKKSSAVSLNAETKTVELDPMLMAEHLSRVIQCKTVSSLDHSAVDLAEFDQLHKILEADFPVLHQKLEKTVLNGHNLIYRWEGSHTDLDPILLMAHQDVVPVDPATAEEWTEPGFSGKIADGRIWGRGSQDCKNVMISAMEAVEALINSGYTPERTIYLAFGQDEEVGGAAGQKEISAHFKEQNIHFAAVLDEGGAIMRGMMPGVKAPMALIGNAEKGYLSLELKATGDGGHSSMPPSISTIGKLARAIAQVENNPVPGTPKRVVPMFAAMGVHTPFIFKLAFGNLWLFRNFLMKRFTANPRTAAMIRTTTAVTIVNGGVKDNVLPSEASAIVNFRIAPGDTIEGIIEYIQYLVAPYNVEVSIAGEHPWEASAVSDPNSPAFDHLADAIQAQFGEIAIAPYTVMGATDARYYNELSENVFRFSAVKMESEQLNSIHNINEYITVDQFKQSVEFLVALIQRWGQAAWMKQGNEN